MEAAWAVFQPSKPDEFGFGLHPLLHQEDDVAAAARRSSVMVVPEKVEEDEEDTEQLIVEGQFCP